MIGTSKFTKVKISNILDSQILDFIQEESPDFKDFLNQYYISEEHEFGSTYLSDNLTLLKDIGATSNNILNVSIPNTLTADISAFDDEILVTTTTGYPDQYGLFKIDNEIITYTGKTSTSFTGCIRGFSSISSIEKSEYLTFSVTDSSEHFESAEIVNLSSIFINEFYKKHKSQFLPGFEGREFVDQVNIENILTRAKDFYRSKGTDASLEILFKVLFGKSVVIEKPFENTIGSSDSEWVVTDNMIVDVIEGDPFKLISTKIFQGTFDNPTADGTISNIQEVFLGSKKYYKLSFDKAAHFGTFDIGTKTKITEQAPTGSSTINVESTVGFKSKGTFIYKHLDEFLVASYTSKSENQFFGCTGIVDSGLLENSDIIDDTFIFGYEEGDPEKVCTMRITGTISKPSDNVINSKYASVGETIGVNYLGEKQSGPKFDTWLYNHSSILDIEGVAETFNEDGLTNIITTRDSSNFLYQGCKVDVIRFDWAGSTQDPIYGATNFSFITPGRGYTIDTNVPTFTTSGSGTGLTVDIIEVNPIGAVMEVVVNNPGVNYELGDVVAINQPRVETLNDLENLETNSFRIAKIDVTEVKPVGYGKVKPSDPGNGAFSVVHSDVTVQSINSTNGHITLLLETADKPLIDNKRPYKIKKKLAYADSSLDELSPNLLSNIQNTYVDDIGNTYVSFTGYPSHPIQTTNRSVKVDTYEPDVINEVFVANSNHSFLTGEEVFFEQEAETIGITDTEGNEIKSGKYYASVVGINSFRLAVTYEELKSGNFLRFIPPEDRSGIVTFQASVDTNFSDLTGTQITPAGGGGFNMGGPYLHFAASSGSRSATLKKFDARNALKIKVYAKVGNDSNGGEDPDAPGEEIQLDYRIDNGSFVGIGTIIPILSKSNAAPVNDPIQEGDYNDGSLKVFELDIPDEAKKENVFFRLLQLSPTGPQYDHYGIQKIEITQETPGITTCTITPNALANNTLTNQNQFKRILKTPEIRESENKLIGPVGVQLNGVELYSPILEDYISYGQIDDIVIKNSGSDYDVVNPPNIVVTNTNGNGAKLHGHFSGNISEIVVTNPGFNYADTPQVSVSGGNASSLVEPLVGKVYMRGFTHSFSFNDISELVTRVDLASDSVIHGEDNPHKFENGEEVVYTATGTPIGIGSTAVGFDTSRLTSGSTYFIRKNSEVSFSLTVKKSDALSGINTIDFNQFGTGTHTLTSKKIRKIVDRISLLEKGVKYQNRKVVVDSNVYPPSGAKNVLTTFTGINKHDDYIFAKNHGFKNGDVIEYLCSGTVISGLSTESLYKVSVIDNNKFRLSNAGTATTITNSNYNQKIYVNLGSVGVGTHTFKYQDIIVKLIGNPSAGLVTSTLPSYYNATAYPVVSGSLDNVFVQNGGTGYGTSTITNYLLTPTVEIERGKGAELRAIVKDGKISNIIISREGSGYSSAPTLDVVGVGVTSGKFAKLKANVLNGKISSVTIIDGGKNYVDKETVINVIPKGIDCKLSANVHKWNLNARARYDTILNNQTFKDTAQVASEVKLQNKLVSFYPGVKYRKDLNDNIDVSNAEISPPSSHSPILGWSYDGNPIYGPYGFGNPVTGGEGVVRLNSSYELDIINDDSLRPNKLDGYFVEDYQYTGNGELDQFNGRFGKTPDFPNGIYAYFTTNTVGNSQFPYTTFLHRNKTDVVNYDIDFKQTDIVIDSGKYKRNVSPLGINEKFRDYPALTESLKTNPKLKVTSSLPGKIKEITTFNSGKDYKVGDIININDPFVDAAVGEVSGKEIKKVESIENIVNNLNFSVKDNVVTASSDSVHNFSNDDIVEISGITSSSYFGIQGLQKIGVNTTSTFVSVAIANTTTTGISTFVEFDEPTNSGVFKVNDVVQVDSEKLLITGLDKINNRYAVSRMHGDSSIGGSHSLDSTVTRLERSFTYKVNGKEIKNTNVDEEKIAYVNVTNSIGIGTTYTSVVVGTAGSSNITKSIPPRAIYIPNHNFKSGDKVSLVSIGGTIIASENDSLTPDFDLSTINPLYCVKISNNYIGLSKEKVGFLTTYVYYKSVQDNDFFGKEVQIKTNTNTLTGSAKGVNGLVTLGTSHNVSVNDTIRLNISPNRTEYIKFEFDTNTRTLVSGSKTFTNTGIGTSLSTITINNHGFDTGDALLYNVTSGSAIGGLLDNTIYYAIKISENIIKLSETYKKATKKRYEAIKITSIGNNGSLAKVNSKIEITRGNNLEIDVSDTSLNGLDINFYSDSNFKDKISLGFIERPLAIGESEPSNKFIIRTNNTSIEKLYYRVENDNLLDNFANTDIQNHSLIDIVESKFNALQTVSGVGNTTITFNSKVGSAETTLYSSYETSGFSTATYSTNSRNEQGSISKINIINFGKNTNKIPSVTSVGTTTGVNAVFSILSDDIAKIEDTEVSAQGWEFPKNKSLKPKANTYAILDLRNTLTLKSIGISTGGKNYTTPPKVIGVGNSTITTRSTIDGFAVSEVEIISNDSGLQEDLRIVPTFNSNGVTVINAESSSMVGGQILKLELKAPIGGFTSGVPFAVGDEVFVENVQIKQIPGIGGTTLASYNSSAYDYRFFEVLEVSDGSASANPHIKYSIAGISTTIAGNFDGNFLFGRVTKADDLAAFEPVFQTVEYVSGEVITIGDGKATAVVSENGWDPQSRTLKITNIVGVFDKNDEIIGSVNSHKATISDFNTYEFNLDIDVFAESLGFWKSDKNKPSFNYERLHDNDYYQRFSYALRGEVDYETWKEPVNSLGHISGYKNFADYEVISNTFVGVSTIPKTDVAFKVEVLSNASVHEQFDYDFVSEEETLGTEISREVAFQSKKLTDYIEAQTNKVLILDDISNQFTGLTTDTGQLVGLKSFALKSDGKSILHQLFNPANLTVGDSKITIIDHGFTDGEELEYAPNSGGTSIGIVTTSAPGIAETSILPSKVFANVADSDNFSLVIKASESAAGSAVTFYNVSGVGDNHSLSVNAREASLRSLITVDNIIQSPLGKKLTVLGLSTSVGIGSTQIFLNDISKVSGNSLLKINDEILYTGLVGIGFTNSVNVVRGYMGTVAAAHTVGAGVSELYGDYRVSKGNIYFSDAPYGPTGINTLSGPGTNPPALTTRSTFTGRVFFRKNDIAEGRPGTMNRIIDDISDSFTGIGKTFTITENSSILPVGITTYAGAILINNIFQKPFFGDVGSIIESDYVIQSPIGGGTTIQFLANPALDTDTTDIPRGGRINEFLVGVGSGYQVPTRALAYANIGVGGTIESVSISTHGQGYITAPRVAIGVSYANYTHKFIRSLSNSINPNAGSNKTPTFAEYDSFTGDLFLVIPSHGLTTSNTIQIVDNSLFFTCSRDGYEKEKSYPRSTDPASGKNLAITNATTNTIIVNVGAGAGVGAAFTSVVSAAGTITAINVVNPGTGYTATKDEPFIIIDEPTPYKNIPLIGGNGSGAKMDVVVGTGGSVINFNIADRGTGYEIGDNLVLHGLPVQVGIGTSAFNITVRTRYQDKFSGFTFGELIELDDFSQYFNGFRRTFLLTRSNPDKEYFSIVAKDGSGIVLQNNLLVFVNDILQKPGVDYIFEGGTRFKFTEAPKAGSRFKLYFFKGSASDVISVDVDETIKPGDILTLDRFDQDKNNINEFPTQDPRVIYELTSATVVETQTYTGPGISSDSDYIRPVRWKKQTVDKIIDGERIQKNRNLNTSQQYPSTVNIAPISATDTVFNVEDVIPFNIDNLSATANGIKIVKQKESQVAKATATVNLTTEKVSQINLVSGGSGYTSAPKIAIQPPSNVGSGVTATATATIDGNGVVNAINITSSGDGYTFTPQVIFEEEPIIEEKFNGVSYSGDRGLIIGVTSITSGSNSGVSTDSPALTFDIFPTQTLLGAPNNKTGIVTGQYIVIQGTSFGDGVVSIGTHTSKIVSVGNSFADNVYQVGHYVDVGTGSTIRRITCNISSLSGINTNTGVTTNRFIGSYSWGTITVPGTRNTNSYEFYNQNGLSGIQTSAHISRTLQLKQVY